MKTRMYWWTVFHQDTLMNVALLMAAAILGVTGFLVTGKAPAWIIGCLLAIAPALFLTASTPTVTYVWDSYNNPMGPAVAAMTGIFSGLAYFVIAFAIGFCLWLGAVISTIQNVGLLAALLLSGTMFIATFVETKIFIKLRFIWIRQKRKREQAA